AKAARVGIITSRKTGSAVERSRVRRRLREIFRLHRRLLPAGLWMVIVPRRAAVDAQFAALRDEWRALCVRGGYLQKVEG
ncbi:MAG: ribonuclease P protein component, partial [Chthoniobacterales bacterium]